MKNITVRNCRRNYTAYLFYESNMLCGLGLGPDSVVFQLLPFVLELILLTDLVVQMKQSGWSLCVCLS